MSMNRKIVLMLLMVLVIQSFAEEFPDITPLTIPDDDLSKPFELSDCRKPVENFHIPQRCRANLPVFHWNHEIQKCEDATYGGCHATRNKFDNIEDCQRIAEAVCKGK